MSSIALAGTMFGCVFASTVAALLIARRLPSDHLSAESRDTIKLGLGVITTLTALVVGLLVAATKGTYDAQTGTVRELASQLALLDRLLSRYGPDAKEARGQLRTLTHTVARQIWPDDGGAPVDLGAGESQAVGEALLDSISTLEPKTEVQRILKGRALEIVIGLAQIRQRLVVHNERSIPPLFLMVLGLWQAILFAGLGLLTPRNATAIIVLIICMMSISAALFLVLELDRPFEGMLRVSDAPFRAVLAQMGP